MADPFELARAEVFGTLAERINDQHRACLGAASMALAHALAAGDLLREAKEGVRHREWGAWLDQYFDGSRRTAQVYMLLARRREEIEEAEAQSPAVFSISDALRALTAPVLPPPWSFPGLGPPGAMPTEKEREQEARQKAQERARERQNKEAPAEMRAGERVKRAAEALRPVANDLYRLAHPRAGFRPEEAGQALALIGDASTLAALRDCAAWLVRVIEEAERARGKRGG